MGTEKQVQEDTMVAYPGRTFSYEQKFNDRQDKLLLNEQRAGRIYVKYEKNQSCFHITVRE